MNLSVYTIKERKHFVQLLEDPNLSSLSASEIKVIVLKSITEEQAVNITVEPKQPEVQKLKTCPSCGKKTLKLARLFKGVSCRCGYSKMDAV